MNFNFCSILYILKHGMLEWQTVTRFVCVPIGCSRVRVCENVFGWRARIYCIVNIFGRPISNCSPVARIDLPSIFDIAVIYLIFLTIESKLLLWWQGRLVWWKNGIKISAIHFLIPSTGGPVVRGARSTATIRQTSRHPANEQTMVAGGGGGGITTKRELRPPYLVCCIRYTPACCFNSILYIE